MNKFLGFSRGQRLRPIDKVVLSPLGLEPSFHPFLKYGSFGT